MGGWVRGWVGGEGLKGGCGSQGPWRALGAWEAPWQVAFCSICARAAPRCHPGLNKQHPIVITPQPYCCHTMTAGRPGCVFTPVPASRLSSRLWQ